jgi:MarR family transcriptional regulator, organic hydroperoxide resistance regulator
MTRTAAIEQLRSAFVELVAADRRLRARDPQQPGDLSQGQVRALFKFAGDEEITAGELAKRAELSPASMTAMLDALEKAGMVERHRSETDRRQVIVRLTPAGQERLQERKRAWNEHWQKSLGHYSDDELEGAARVVHSMAGLLDAIGR